MGFFPYNSSIEDSHKLHIKFGLTVKTCYSLKMINIQKGQVAYAKGWHKLSSPPQRKQSFRQTSIKVEVFNDYNQGEFRGLALYMPPSRIYLRESNLE